MHSSTYTNHFEQPGDGTCVGNADNRTAYWVPAVINTSGKAVIPDYAVVYYKSVGLGRFRNPADIAQVQRMPKGLRMIAGQNSAGSITDPQHKWYCCENGDGDSQTYSCLSGMVTGTSKPQDVLMRQVFSFLLGRSAS